MGRLNMCIKLLLVLIFILLFNGRNELNRVEGSASFAFADNNFDQINVSLFSEEEVEWLKSTTRVNISFGFPSSITPLNYFYYSTISKGVITDIGSEFFNHTGKSVGYSPITMVGQNDKLLQTGVLDVIVTGKKADYADVVYSTPIVEFEYSFFVSDSSSINLVEQLENQAIGIVNNDDNILTYLDGMDQRFNVVEYNNYIDLYNALDDEEIKAVFVPRELLSYQNLSAGAKELSVADFAVSQWYFASSNSMIIQLLNKVLGFMVTSEKYANHYVTHENALNNKLYNFDKSTHEWLFYDKPVLKVGVYDVTAFMSMGTDGKVSGLTGYIFKQLKEKFGVEFEFIPGTYDDLYEAFKNGEIDLLPVFVFELNKMEQSNYKLELQELGHLYKVYQGEVNAYSDFSTLLIEDAIKSNNDVRLGSLIAPLSYNQEFLKLNNLDSSDIVMENTISSAISSLKSKSINYVMLDPVFLDYFTDYEMYSKGKLGKYTLSFLVADNGLYAKFFDAIQKREFETNANFDKYGNLLGTEMYLYEMSLLKDDIYAMQQQRYFYILVFIGCGGLILFLVKQRYDLRRTEHLKYTDHLTGLLNRLGYEREIAKVIKNKPEFAFMIFDVDHFKMINDTYGHIVGDLVISHVANTLKGTCPDESVICRLGGDEFVACVKLSSIVDVKEVLNKISKNILEFHMDDEQCLYITTSIGVVMSLTDDVDLEMLYSRADRALYVSKEKGRNLYTIFDEMD